MKYTDWYIDPSYSSLPTLWRDGFAICLVPAQGEQSTWSFQAYDERNGAHTTGRMLFEETEFETESAARHAAKARLFELER